ncbi:cytosolic factor, phosphatidylinositol/phosphatidylcholine transfer protein [Microbotryomycetes sp. JL221]|nr:cytosolic factor, phosphatidylinositol/phosphatidylcholine transfer protein [Microbotryomycetes sp. JL221]
MPDKLEFPKAERTVSSASVQARVGHLSTTNQDKLNQFKQQLTEAELWKPDRGDGRPTHDDSTLVRFLRARKFDLTGAFKQFKETEDWRRTKHMDELYDTFSVEEFIEAQSVYTAWTGRRAKDGSPLYVYKIGTLTKEKIATYSADSSRLDPRLMVLMEALPAFTMPLCNACSRPDMSTPIDSTISIIDVTGVSMSRFWQLKSHMQRASVMATNYMPETLGRLFIVGAPSFFSVIWSWINRWFDPGTVEKLSILSTNEVSSTLTKFIEPQHLPKVYGGELNWKFGDQPNLDDEMKKVLGFDAVPRGTLRFDQQTKELKLMGTGRDQTQTDEWLKEHRVQSNQNSEAEADVSEKQQSTPQTQDNRTLAQNETTQMKLIDDNNKTTQSQLNEPSQKVEKREIRMPAIVIDGPSPSSSPPTTSPTAIVSPLAHHDEEAHSRSIPSSTTVSNGTADATVIHENGHCHQDEHTIEDAKRENAAAPVKALAAELQGTTL